MAPHGGDRGTSNRGTGRDVRPDTARPGIAPRVEARRDDALDANLAALATISSVKTALQVGQLAGDEIGAVLRHAERAAQRFDAAPGPLTQQAVAGDLLEAYRVLRDRERVARRGPRGELLKEVRSAGGAISFLPWASSGPTELDRLVVAGAVRPLFGRENIARWLTAVSYRGASAPPATGARRRRATPASAPVDSAGVHAYNLTFVEGKGNIARRRTLPWPLPALVIPRAYKIDLVKGPGMSFLTRDGRTKILAYLLEVVAETNSDGDVYWSEKGESVAPETLAAFIIETAAVGIGRLLFEGPEAAFKVFERAQPGYVTDFIITDEMIQILWYYTEIQPRFRRKERAESASGCGSIEWITELLKEVPHRYKQMWVQDRLMNDRAVYPDNLRPGMLVPAQYFLTETTAEALGGEDHQVLFITSLTANDRVILTEDGRVWLVKEHERNLQAFCQAVVQLQGILTLSFIFASAIGAVLGGPLVGFLMTAGDVAIDINQAGGIRKFLKGLKDNPLKAGWFMLDLVSAVGDVRRMRTLLMNPNEAIEASMRIADDAAKAKRALPKGAGEAVDAGTDKVSRLADGANAAHDEARLADANRTASRTADVPPAAPPGARQPAPPNQPHEPATGAKANTRPVERPTPGQPAAGTRASAPPTESPRTSQDTPRAKSEPDAEVELTDSAADARKAADSADAAETAAGRGRRRRPSRERARGPFGTVRDVRQRRPQKPKTGRGGRRQSAPGSRPIRGSGRANTAAKTTDPMQAFLGKGKQARDAAEKLERLDCGELLREIAREWARRAADGRKLLVRIGKLTDDEIQGLAAVRRALNREPVIRQVRGGTSHLGWMDVLHLPSGARSDLLKLVGRLEPVVESGLSRALGRALDTGAYSVQGGLGHFHAAAHLADEYRALGIRMVMEEPVYVARLGFREIDIRATIGGTLDFDIEIKTYLGQLVMYDSVRRQIAKDLVRHIDDGWEGMRYLFSPNVERELGVFRQGILEAFDTPAVQAAVRGRNLDAVKAREALLRRLDDAGHPMVAVYRFVVGQ